MPDRKGPEVAPAPRRGGPPPERRLWERYPALGAHVILTWSEGTAQRAARGELRDIGGEGAAVVADASPPLGTAVELRLETGGRRIDPVECRLIRAAEEATGGRVAHLRFLGQCPIELFDLATGQAE